MVVRLPADINSAETLLHVLRNHIELKGTRYGCGIEQCGACMVLVNGKPAYSCTFAGCYLSQYAWR